MKMEVTNKAACIYSSFESDMPLKMESNIQRVKRALELN